MGDDTPKPPLTIHPHSKLCGILAILLEVVYTRWYWSITNTS